jgi:SagB-type dehydrogenase family enzyme
MKLLTLGLLAALAAPACWPADASLLALPAPKKDGGASVEAALAARRSIRAYDQEPMTMIELGQLLWAAQGVTSADGKRTAPSAMHKYPLEIAVVIQNVCCLPNGAYRYLPAKHALELLALAKTGESMFGSVAAQQPQVKSAAAVFVIAAVYERMGTGARNHTFTDYEAGLASENLLLESVSLGLGGVVTGGIDASLVKQGVHFTGPEEVIVIIPVGHPAK